MLPRLTPAETREKLRRATPEQLFAVRLGKDPRDAAIAAGEIAERKAKRTFVVPSISDRSLARHLIASAVSDFGSRDPRVQKLRDLDHADRERRIRVPFLETVESVLRHLYGEPGPETRAAGDSEPPAVPGADFPI